MKKRILCIALVLSFLLSVLPIGAAAQEETAEEFVITPLSFPLEESGHSVRTPEDEIGDISLIKASPGMKNQCAAQLDWMKLTFFLYDSGTADTYFTVKVYDGNSTSGDLVVDKYGQFPGERGFYSVSFSLRSIGSRTNMLVVMESATMSGDKLIPIPGTRSTETVHEVKDDIPVTTLSVVEMDSRKDAKKIALPTDRLTYLEFVMTPEKNTHSRYFNLTEEGGAVDFESVGGLLILAPKAYGWSTVTATAFHPDTHEPLVIEIEVCINEKGHINQQTVTMATADKDLEGVVLHYCPDCGSNYLEFTGTGAQIFSQLKDVSAEQWYYENVKAAVENGLFNGVSASNFNPEDSMTRAMLVTVLWRYAGQPAAGETAFADVPEGQWYTRAIAWAAEQGIVSGVGKGLFEPDGKVTREQMATILYRYARQNGLDVTTPSDVLQTFPDADKISAYAIDPLSWTVHQGIIGGTREGNTLFLDPQGSATRAQVAAILTRFIDKYYPAGVLSPDTEGAEESGSVKDVKWAFYPDGTLAVGGCEIMPGFGTQYQHVDRPWAHLKDRVTKVVVLEGVTLIGDSAFSYFSNLKEIQLPRSLRKIQAEAFAYCTALEKVELPAGTRLLGEGVFRGCTSLKEAILPDSIYLQGHGIQNDLDARYLFASCSSLESITLPVGMQRVSECMFAGCTALKEVNFGPGQSWIDMSGFSGCISLESMILPVSVEYIVDEAFYGCKNLKHLMFLNPMARVQYIFHGEYNAPFGIRGTATVYAYSFTQVAQVAQAEGYAFVSLESLIE